MMNLQLRHGLGLLMCQQLASAYSYSLKYRWGEWTTYRYVLVQLSHDLSANRSFAGCSTSCYSYQEWGWAGMGVSHLITDQA